MALAFSPEADKQISEIQSRYPTHHAALIPTLFVAQKEFGWISHDVMRLVADRLELSVLKVASTATFYTMFNKKPVGRFHVQVCKNISCYLRGSDNVEAYISKTLGIRPGETTADGAFTFSQAECLAACGRAPVVQINEEYHEWQSPASLAPLLDELQARHDAMEGGHE